MYVTFIVALIPVFTGSVGRYIPDVVCFYGFALYARREDYQGLSAYKDRVSG